MAKIILNKFGGGLPLGYGKIKTDSLFKNVKLGREGSYVDSETVDAFRNIGTIVPGPAHAALVNPTLIDAIATEFVVHTDNGKVYLIAGAKVHEITISSDTITSDAGSTFPVTINTTAVLPTFEILFNASGYRFAC